MATAQPLHNVVTAAGARSRSGSASQPLRIYGWAVLVWNVLVVLWGALVRATGSGAGCGNHWPLCNGEVIPQSPGIHTIIEFTHRMMTGGSGFVVIALLVWVLRGTAKEHAARKYVTIATVLLFIEALLGALLVKLGYVTGNRSVGRVIVLSIHFTNTLVLLASLTATAWALSATGFVRLRLRSAHVIGLLATIVVGVSGSLAALGDTLFPATSLRAAFVQDFAASAPLILRLRSVHPVSAIVAAVFVLWLLVRAAWHGEASERRLATIVAGLLVFQFILGLLDLALLAPAWMQIVHLLGADLYWIALLLLVFNGASVRVAEPLHKIATS